MRPATEADVQAIADLCNAVGRASATSTSDARRAAAFRSTSASIRMPGEKAWRTRSSHRSGDPTWGWVGTLGVRRPWRRRGLGLALLQHAFGEFRRRGMSRAGLDVDAENTTGAVALYEHAGMHVERRRDTFEKAL